MSSRLIYNRAPTKWEEALPVGNGIVNAMLFGDPFKDRIQLNEDSLWSGGKRERLNTLSKDNYKKVRELIEEGEIQKAESLVRKTMLPSFPHMTHHQTAGDIWIEHLTDNPMVAEISEVDEMGIPRVHRKESKISNYARSLNLEEAVWQADYESDNKAYSLEGFTHEDANVLVYKIKASSINCIINYTRKDLGSGKCQSYIDKVTSTDDFILAEGTNGNINEGGIGYCIGIKVCNIGGEQYSNGSGIIIEQAEELVLFVTIRTTFRSDSPKEYCLEKLNELSMSDYESLKDCHISIHKEQYERFSFELFDNKGEHESVSTDARINNFGSDGTINDIKLVELFVDYGKYLQITSSNRDSLPSTLQGKWNQELAPYWGGKYALNINTEMNYNFALKMGLFETVKPLIEHIKRMIPNGRKVAKSLYGLDGFVCHHTTDLWGDCAPQDQNMMTTIWPMGGAWVSLVVIDYYLYTNDRKFLQEHFYILKENAKFLNEYMFKNKAGRWVTGPSASPENYYETPDGVIASVCNGPTIDIQITYDLFSAYLFAVEELGMSCELVPEVERKVQEIQPFRVDSNGRVMEWDEEYDSVDKGHRHISHLYAAYPSRQLDMSKEEVNNAVENTVRQRLKHGGGHTSWSLAWILNIWAKIGCVDDVRTALIELVSKSYANLFTKHPPFQIDGNMGGTDGIISCFVHDDKEGLILNRAVPDELGSGEIKRYRSIHGVIVDMVWDEGEVTELVIEGTRDVQVLIKEYTKDGDYTSHVLNVDKGEIIKLK